MIKICDVKSEIENLEITIDEAITIQVTNFLDFFFAQFFDILSHKAREKKKFLRLKSLAKLLEDEELRMKNQDKAKANYAKQFIKKKANCWPNLRTLKVLLQARYQSANFVKRKISQMSTGTYKQNDITITKLVI